MKQKRPPQLQLRSWRWTEGQKHLCYSRYTNKETGASFLELRDFQRPVSKQQLESETPLGHCGTGKSVDALGQVLPLGLFDPVPPAVINSTFFSVPSAMMGSDMSLSNSLSDAGAG